MRIIERCHVGRRNGGSVNFFQPGFINERGIRDRRSEPRLNMSPITMITMIIILTIIGRVERARVRESHRQFPVAMSTGQYIRGRYVHSRTDAPFNTVGTRVPR